MPGTMLSILDTLYIFCFFCFIIMFYFFRKKKTQKLNMASPIAQSVKNLPAMQETWVRSLGWEDPLEKEMATHSSILSWKIP